MTPESLLLIALLPVAAALAVALWVRSILIDARNRVAASERLAAARGRCLSLAAQELRGPGLALMAQAEIGRAHV